MKVEGGGFSSREVWTVILVQGVSGFPIVTITKWRIPGHGTWSSLPPPRYQTSDCPPPPQVPATHGAYSSLATRHSMVVVSGGLTQTSSFEDLLPPYQYPPPISSWWPPKLQAGGTHPTGLTVLLHRKNELRCSKRNWLVLSDHAASYIWVVAFIAK